MKVAVVGLGIAGLSVCARLAEAGHDVDGFEQFALMHALGSSHGDTRIMRGTPGEGDIYVCLAERALPLWHAWERAHGAPLISWTGGMMAGPKGSAFVASCAALNVRYGRDAAKPGDIEGLSFDPNWDTCFQSDCGVIAADTTRLFLIAHATKLGAHLHENVRVAPIDGVTLRINDEARAFDAVIVSAGGWARTLLPEFAGRLTAYRRVMAWFRPLADSPPRVPIICVDDDIGVYGMPTPDGLYKIGSHSIGEAIDPDAVRLPDAADAALLSGAARAYLPLHNPEPVRIARCLYTVTPDENFLVTPSRAHARVLLFSCCSGHGFKYAPAYGEMALDWVEGRRSDFLDAFGLHGPDGVTTPLGGRSNPG